MARWSSLLCCLVLVASGTGCSSCNDLGCSGGVTFSLDGLDLRGNNFIEAQACLERRCERVSARYSDKGVGSFSGDGDLQIDPLDDGISIRLGLPPDVTLDSKTPHEVTLDATVNGEAFEVTEEVVLRPIIAGCSSCWGVNIEVE